MSQREELENRYSDIVWKQERLKKELTEIENKFKYWKDAYVIVETELKIFKNLLRDL